MTDLPISSEQGHSYSKKPYTVEQLEQRFILEKKRRDRNLSTKSKSFYKELDLLFNGLDESQSTLEEYISLDSR